MNSIRVAVWSYEFERPVLVEILESDTRQAPVVVRHQSVDHEGSVSVVHRYWVEDGVVWATYHSEGVDGEGRLVCGWTKAWEPQTESWDVRDVECNEPR